MAQKTVRHVSEIIQDFRGQRDYLSLVKIKEDVTEKKKVVLKDSWNCGWLRRKVRKVFQRKE